MCNIFQDDNGHSSPSSRTSAPKNRKPARPERPVFQEEMRCPASLTFPKTSNRLSSGCSLGSRQRKKRAIFLAKNRRVVGSRLSGAIGNGRARRGRHGADRRRRHGRGLCEATGPIFGTRPGGVELTQSFAGTGPANVTVTCDGVASNAVTMAFRQAEPFNVRRRRPAPCRPSSVPAGRRARGSL